jgi:hypothetical protein
LTLASTWVQLEKIPLDVANDDNNRYVDIDSLRRDGSVFNIWLSAIQINKVLTEASLVYVDCKSQANKYDSFIVNLDKFVSIRGEYFPIPVEKYTTGRQLYNMFCK